MLSQVQRKYGDIMEALPAGFWPEDEVLFEALNQYFVIEIWVESGAGVEVQAAWRARMTHGPSGEQWVVRSVEELNWRIAEIMNTSGLMQDARCQQRIGNQDDESNIQAIY